MKSCFKGGETSGLWNNGVNNTRTAVYTSVSDFNQDRAPKISKIIENLKQFDVFKYSAYRTAFKLRTIQKASKLHMIDLSFINGILKDYDCGDNSVTEVITPDKAENLICTLYTEAGKQIGISEEPNIMALLFLAFLQNTFVENDKPLLFIHVKIALVLFSSAKLSEKFKYFFYYCSKGNTISKENLHQLLYCLSKVAEIVGEQVTFGAHLVPAALKHLLKFSKGRVTLKKFQKWFSLEPQTLVWISVLHRISASEISQHFVSCDYCHVNPVVGLRYKCLQCCDYNLCQNCFLCGYFNKVHKERHQVQEFCRPASMWEEAKATLSIVKNKLPFTRCPTKPYLSFDEESVYESMRDVTKNASRNSLMNHTLKKTTAAYIVKELSSIVKKLEEDKNQISAVVDNLNKEVKPGNDQENHNLKKMEKELSSGECLQTYSFSLEKQLARLRELLQGIQSPNNIPKEPTHLVSPVPHAPFSKTDHFFESTPLNSAAFPTEPIKTQIVFPNSDFDDSENTTELPRNQSTSLDFTTALNSNTSNDLSNSNEPSSVSRISGPSENYSTSMSLGLSRYLNITSSLNLSERMAKLAENNFSPIYMYSSSDISKSLKRKSVECKFSVTPMKSSVSFPSLQKAGSTFTLNKNESLEALELELQTMLQHIEELLPQVSGLSNSSLTEKETVANAISNMESAVKKLSHLSLALSIGSTDL